MTVGHRAHGVDQIVRVGVLEQEARSTGAQRLEQVVLPVEGREDDDLGSACGHDAPGGLEPVHVRHLHVHQHDVDTALGNPLHGLATIGGLAHDLEVVLDGEHHGEA